MLALNQHAGYAEGDRLVKAVAECLGQQVGPGLFFARLGAAAFAVVHVADGAVEASRLAEKLTSAVNDRVRSFAFLPLHTAAGWVPGLPGVNLPSLLAAADRALAQARTAGAGSVKVLTDDPLPGELQALGAQGWLAWVAHALAAGAYSLAIQEVRSVSGMETLHREVFLRLHDPGGSVLPAHVFLPLVQREGGTDTLDRAMLDLLATAQRDGRISAQPVAANLSPASWRSAAFAAWLVALLEDWPVPCRPVIELREAEVVETPDLAARFAQAVRAAGATIAVDHYGVAAGGIACLRRLLPAYVKLDDSLARGLDAAEQRFQVEALVRIARTLDIPVWAQVFDQPSALDVLAEMGVTGAQGYTLAAEQAVPRH